MYILSWKIKEAHQEITRRQCSVDTPKSSQSTLQNLPQDNIKYLKGKILDFTSKTHILKKFCLCRRKSCKPLFFKCLSCLIFLQILMSHALTITLVGDQWQPSWKTICRRLSKLPNIMLLTQSSNQGSIQWTCFFSPT